MARGIIIKLTEEQTEALKPLRDKLSLESFQGSGVGMIVAQVFTDHMDVGFVKHETAKMIVTSLGGDPDRRITTAYQKAPGNKKSAQRCCEGGGLRLPLDNMVIPFYRR